MYNLIPSCRDINNLLNCSECSRKTSGEDIRWCAASRFIKKKSKEEQIAEALEKQISSIQMMLFTLNQKTSK